MRKVFLSELLIALYIGVYLKGTNFGCKVIDRQFFHRETVFMKILPISNFTIILHSIKNYFLNEPK